MSKEPRCQKANTFDILTSGSDVAIADLDDGVSLLGSPPTAPRILLVEDDEHNAEIARVALVNAGFVVTWVDAGEAALACAREGGWAAIVLDMHLPDLDGLGVSRALRADATHSDVPILGVSALASTADRAAASAAGIDVYLTKPYRRQELLDALTEAIARRRG